MKSNRSHITAGILLLSLGLQTERAIAESTTALSPSDFGFERSETQDLALRKTVTLTDRENGRTLQTTYSPLGNIEFQSEAALSGRILSRREIRAHQEIQEQFVPTHTRTTFQSKRPGWIAVEQTTWINGKARTVSYEIREEKALQRCEPERSSTPVDQLLADMSWLSFRPETNKAAVPLGNNFVAQNCKSYPHGGVDGLARALTEGLQTGLSCLARLGPERRMDAARMLAFLDEKSAKKAKIRCGHVGQVTGRGEPDSSKPGRYIPIAVEKDEIARAYTIESPDFPALQLNLDSESLKEKDTQAQQTIFHEMLHWLGYKHGHGVDVTYLTEICCFHSKDDWKNNRENACQLLKDNPDFESEEYHRRFAKVMNNNFRSNIALDAAWKSIRGRTDTSSLYASVYELANSDRSLFESIQWNYREKGDPLFYMVLARASVGSLPPEKKKAAIAQVAEKIDSVYPNGPIKDAAMYLGDSLNAIINRNAEAFKSSWAKFEGIKKAACSQMQAHEKEELGKATDLAIVDYFKLKLPPPSYYDKLKKPCP